MSLNDKVNLWRLCNAEIESQRKKNYQKKKKCYKKRLSKSFLHNINVTDKWNRTEFVIWMIQKHNLYN